MLFRTLILKLAQSEALMNFIAHMGRRSGLAGRFVAGESIEEAMPVVQELNDKGIVTSLNLLGEEVSDKNEAERSTQSYISLLKAIHENRVESNVSIKLTQLGLGIHRQVCEKHLRAILDTARALNNFVRIDMEGSRYTQDILDLFQQTFSLYPNHVGVVIQAYLYRSEEDVRQLSPLGCNIRLCKGAYMEPADIAFPKRQDVDRNFIKLLELLLLSPSYTAIATHNVSMIEHAHRFTAQHDVPLSHYEYQMVYGVGREYQNQIIRRGNKMRVYVPFGTHWAPYLVRRLAERPANLLFLLKSLFRS
ncbi:MAG: proline dehydrogenase family protein [Acidobacteria bacterium]|nr:proline dehydrogenase family protein [Acidobacteriota bacterium]